MFSHPARHRLSRPVRRRLVAALALAAFPALPTPGVAQGWIDVERPRHPVAAVSDPVTRVSSAVTVTVDGHVARIGVEERFRNTGGFLAEGSYLYPLSGEAVFSDFSLWMGDREQRGEVMDADRARAIYEDIVRRQRDPALLTLEGHGLIRARVFPIQPGETRKVALRYTQMLERTGDVLRFRYAMGRRGGKGSDFMLVVPDAVGLGEPYSPTHQLSTRRRGDRLEVILATAGEGDVEIFLPRRRTAVGGSLVTHSAGASGGFFMLLLTPPAAERQVAVPRDLTFVVDVSGSMAGDKMEQARAALLQALGSLGASDRFRLIAFSSRVRPFREGFAEATPANVRAAQAFVEGVEATGGTNIAGALDAALSQPSPAGRLPLVIFLTDGLPSVGEQAPDRIAEQAAGRIGRARIFTVGVGHDVNTYLLDRLAREGRGAAEYVAPGASVEQAIGGLLSRIERPALVNLRILDSPVRLTSLQPAVLPDLVYGDELVVFGRYDGRAGGPVVIEGERNGRRERFTVQADFGRAQANAFVAQLWAARRVGELTRQIRLEGATPALLEEVKSLALEYGILSEYTAYLVQEPTLVRGGPALMPSGTPLEDASLLGGASAARAQTGAKAFERADQSARLGNVTSLTAAEALSLDRERRDAPGARGARTKRVGGRIFVERDGVWTDVAHTDTVQTVTVAPFSDAYFALARALPELASCLAAGEEVVVAGKRLSVKITAGGRSEWSAGELAAVVRRFRGT